MNTPQSKRVLFFKKHNPLMDQLKIGTLVQFNIIPLGSYLRANEPYVVVCIDKDHISWRCPTTGAGTWDKRSDVAHHSDFKILN